MKIIVKKGEKSITIDESDNISGDKKASLRWAGQAETVHKTIEIMVNQLNNF